MPEFLKVFEGTIGYYYVLSSFISSFIDLLLENNRSDALFYIKDKEIK